MTITQERINQIWKGARHLFNGSPYTETQRLKAALDLSDLATQRGISGLDDYAQMQFRTYGIGRVIDSLAPYVAAEDPMERMEHAAEATRVASDVFRTVSEKRNLDTTIDFALQLYELGMHCNFESLTVDIPVAATEVIEKRKGRTVVINDPHYIRLTDGMRKINERAFEKQEDSRYVLKQAILGAENYELNHQDYELNHPELDYRETGSVSAEDHLELALTAFEIAAKKGMIDLRDRAGRVAKQLGARTGQLHQVKDRITPAYN